VEYNEPRGHAYMIRDQVEIDASRIGAGGVCLSCKSPYSPGLQKQMGADYYRKPFKEVLGMIPRRIATWGCLHRLPRQQGHELEDFARVHADRGLQVHGGRSAKLTRQEMRSAVCASAT